MLQLWRSSGTTYYTDEVYITASTNKITATTFAGALVGNATTATNLTSGAKTIGGALTVSGTSTVNGPANTVNRLNSSSGYSSLMIKSGDSAGYSYLFFNDASAENARIVAAANTLFLQAGASATTVATFAADAVTIAGNVTASGHLNVNNGGTAIAMPSNVQTVIQHTDGFANAGLAITSHANNSCSVFMGDPANPKAGELRYTNSSDSFLMNQPLTISHAGNPDVGADGLALYTTGSYGGGLGFRDGSVDHGIFLQGGAAKFALAAANANLRTAGVYLSVNSTNAGFARTISCSGVGIGNAPTPVAGRLHVRGVGTAATIFLADNSSGQYSIKSANNNQTLNGTPAAPIAAIYCMKSSSTQRSINAAGSVNTGGTDYAEYETKAEGTNDIAKGDVCGFDVDGLLTDKWSESISFCVKSTNPSFVGGDTWGGWDSTTADQSGREEFAETARLAVDRIAYSGKVPVNFTEGNVGDLLVPIEGANDTITLKAVSKQNLILSDLIDSIGKVKNIESDDRRIIIVNVH